jgi:hypothetical protein
MLLKLKKALPIIMFAVVTVLIGSVLFEKCGSNVEHKAFLAQVDSLHKVNDSLQIEIMNDNAVIDSLNYVDAVLTVKLDIAKKNVKVITKYVDSSKSAIDNYTEHQLVTSFNTRYPADTVTNPLPIAQPVLVAAAKDLVELDGAKQIITIKDSAITILETKVSNKDSVISKYISKEDKFRLILLNKDQEIAGWEGQYQKIELQYNKLKIKSKFQRIGSYVVIGGLAYLMLAK